MLIELSDDQIATILNSLYVEMDEYANNDKIILLCRYLYEKYHIEGAKDGAEEKTKSEWNIEYKKQQEERFRIYLQKQQKRYEEEKKRINVTQHLLSKAPVHINEKRARPNFA